MLRLEAGDQRERAGVVERRGARDAVGAHLKDPAVDHDHLAVEPLESPEAEVAVLEQLATVTAPR